MKTTNSGVILDPRSQADKALDYIAGAETPIKYEVLVETGDWSDWKPLDKRQYVERKFDTMNCTSFAVMQAIEVRLNRMLPGLPDTHKKFLQKNGYIDQNKVSLSSRFSGITSGNTQNGNYFQKVWETARKEGVLPELDLPIGGKTWFEYHDMTLVTQAMRNKAKKFLDYFTIQYDWLEGFDQLPGFNLSEKMNTEKILKQCPINIGVPLPVNHAIIMLRFNNNNRDNFDHYEPFLRQNDPRDIGLALRGVVKVKEEILVQKPIYFFTQDMQFGSVGAEVKMLQECLIYLGLLKPGLTTGKFLHITENAVKKLQDGNYAEILKPAGLLKGTGLVRSNTRNYLNKIFKI